jgi:hypothetical protein
MHVTIKIVGLVMTYIPDRDDAVWLTFNPQ